MKHEKKIEGLRARQADYSKMMAQVAMKDNRGFTEPGSIKKPHGKIEKRRG